MRSTLLERTSRLQTISCGHSNCPLLVVAWTRRPPTLLREVMQEIGRTRSTDSSGEWTKNIRWAPDWNRCPFLFKFDNYLFAFNLSLHIIPTMCVIQVIRFQVIRLKKSVSRVMFVLWNSCYCYIRYNASSNLIVVLVILCSLLICVLCGLFIVFINLRNMSFRHYLLNTDAICYCTG